MIIPNNTNVTLMNAVLVNGPHINYGHIEMRTSASRTLLSLAARPPFGTTTGLSIQAGIAGIRADFPDDELTATYTLMTFLPDEQVEYLACIPDEACPIPGVVDRFRALVDEIRNPSLRWFLNRVFGIPEVFVYYFTNPGSIRNHHSRGGGLAQHSVSMAEKVVRSVDDRTQRELGVVLALVHDIGKIWSYERRKLTPEAMQLGHDAVGLIRVFPMLLELRSRWPEGGNSLLAMLMTLSVNREYPKRAAVHSVVRGFDSYDGSSDLHLRNHHRARWAWPKEPPELENAGEDDDQLF